MSRTVSLKQTYTGLLELLGVKLLVVTLINQKDQKERPRPLKLPNGIMSRIFWFPLQLTRYR